MPTDQRNAMQCNAMPTLTPTSISMPTSMPIDQCNAMQCNAMPKLTPTSISKPISMPKATSMPMSNAATNIDANIHANVKCQCQHQCQRQMPIPTSMPTSMPIPTSMLIPTSRQRSMTNTTPIDQCNARLCGFHRDIQLEISIIIQCNATQRNAMQCNARLRGFHRDIQLEISIIMQCNATQRNAMQCTPVWFLPRHSTGNKYYNTMQRNATQRNARLCGFRRDIQLEISIIIQCNATQRNATQCNAMHACVVFTTTLNWKRLRVPSSGVCRCFDTGLLHFILSSSNRTIVGNSNLSSIAYRLPRFDAHSVIEVILGEPRVRQTM
jgi:hypothetical protein